MAGQDKILFLPIIVYTLKGAMLKIISVLFCPHARGHNVMLGQCISYHVDHKKNIWVVTESKFFLRIFVKVKVCFFIAYLKSGNRVSQSKVSFLLNHI